MIDIDVDKGPMKVWHVWDFSIGIVKKLKLFDVKHFILNTSWFEGGHLDNVVQAVLEGLRVVPISMDVLKYIWNLILWKGFWTFGPKTWLPPPPPPISMHVSTCVIESRILWVAEYGGLFSYPWFIFSEQRCLPSPASPSAPAWLLPPPGTPAPPPCPRSAPFFPDIRWLIDLNYLFDNRELGHVWMFLMTFA